ncbi:unnamed protein product [Pneumocystis jirovecii]|uniref:Secreted protein n=1 Tax=Pneumocystis jirovecii TaxID=42068 RepID=L0P6W7_PNEJI|nr:unnamed protein product [Pneumocystis jirovecii]
MRIGFSLIISSHFCMRIWRCFASSSNASPADVVLGGTGGTRHSGFETERCFPSLTNSSYVRRTSINCGARKPWIFVYIP